MFFVLALLSLIVAPEPWDVRGAAACGALGVLEVLYWQRRMRGEKVRTGVENLIGATGKATEPLAPSGHVRVLGELWEARSAEAVPSGGTIRVLAVRGLELDVEAVAEGERRA
ncbi:MAG TPA: NfeD family protein [Gaiellaceae bacterium]|nr:NfeD family protein [Gaiellaceae bacterium]